MTTDQRPPLALPLSVPLRAPPDFAARLAAVGVSLSTSTVAQLGDFLARMLAMNEQMNLTSIREPEEAWERHILDALTLLPLLAELPPGARVIDVGSGGGIPALPLAIARPDLTFTLVEATQKKTSFLGAVSAAMGLSNVSVRAERAEKLVQGELRGAFEAVTARAVARLVTLAPFTVPFARRGGLVLLVKGQRAEEEVAEAKAVLARLDAVHEQTVATPTGRVVILRRTGT